MPAGRGADAGVYMLTGAQPPTARCVNTHTHTHTHNPTLQGEKLQQGRYAWPGGLTAE